MQPLYRRLASSRRGAAVAGKEPWKCTDVPDLDAGNIGCKLVRGLWPGEYGLLRGIAKAGWRGCQGFTFVRMIFMSVIRPFEAHR